MRPKLRVVLAGTYRQYEQWRVDNEIRRNDPDVLFASEWHRLRGIHRPIEVHTVGTFWDRPDALEIAEAARYLYEKTRHLS